jgi:hypothetical protein
MYIYISDKADFKLKLVRLDKESHFILIKGALHQEEIIMFNLNATNDSTSNFIKHTLLDLNAQIDTNTVIVGVSILFNYQYIGHSNKKITTKKC